jgi:ribosomal protein L7/L12
MNNDLSKLSDNELNTKLKEITEAGDLISLKYRQADKEYSNLFGKRRVKADQVIILKDLVEKFELAERLLREYNCTVTDEKNRRIDERNKKQKPEESILEKLKKVFSHYSDEIVEKGYQLSALYAPDRKLQAVKDFKDATNFGLKETKQFMDVAFSYFEFLKK